MKPESFSLLEKLKHDQNFLLMLSSLTVRVKKQMIQDQILEDLGAIEAGEVCSTIKSINKNPGKHLIGVNSYV